jgi:hypothetical protein
VNGQSFQNGPAKSTLGVATLHISFSTVKDKEYHNFPIGEVKRAHKFVVSLASSKQTVRCGVYPAVVDYLPNGPASWSTSG